MDDKKVGSRYIGPRSIKHGWVVDTEDGERRLIVGGSYMGTHGVSNHFRWLVLDDTGAVLSKESGYWKTAAQVVGYVMPTGHSGYGWEWEDTPGYTHTVVAAGTDEWGPWFHDKWYADLEAKEKADRFWAGRL